VAAVARQHGAGERAQRRAGDRQADHQVPRGRVRPQRILELVHERDEHGGEQRGRHADQRPEADQAQVRPALDLRRRHGGDRVADRHVHVSPLQDDSNSPMVP
jgi:hypothetical protein